MKAWLLKLLVEMSNEEYNLPLPPLSPSKTIPSLTSRLLSTNPKAIYIKLKMGISTVLDGRKIVVPKKQVSRRRNVTERRKIV